MKNKLLQRVETSKKMIRFWWATSVVGILMIIVGLVMMIFPTISYLVLSSIVGVVIFVSGISNLALAANSHNIMVGKVWVFASGIVEVLLGFILMFSVAVSELILPVLLGLWMLFKALNIIGVSDDMSILEMPGASWTMLMGILTLLCAFIVISQPLIFGATAVVLWSSIALIILGATLFLYSLQLKKMHHHFKDNFKIHKKVDAT